MAMGVLPGCVSRAASRKQWTERITLPLAQGTIARLDALVENGETRLDIIREAIKQEVARRLRARARKRSDG